MEDLSTSLISTSTSISTTSLTTSLPPIDIKEWHVKFNAILTRLHQLLQHCHDFIPLTPSLTTNSNYTNVNQNDDDDKDDSEKKAQLPFESFHNELQSQLRQARYQLSVLNPTRSIGSKLERQNLLIQELQPQLNEWKNRLNQYITPLSNDMRSTKSIKSEEEEEKEEEKEKEEEEEEEEENDDNDIQHDDDDDMEEEEEAEEEEKEEELMNENESEMK